MYIVHAMHTHVHQPDIPPHTHSIDLSARTNTKRQDLSSLVVGQLAHGHITRVQPFGVFVKLDGGDVSGLVHVSECSHEFVKDPALLFKPGQGVWCVVCVWCVFCVCECWVCVECILLCLVMYGGFGDVDHDVHFTT